MQPDRIFDGSHILLAQASKLVPRRAKAVVYIAQLPADRILCRLGESAAADRFTESDRSPWETPSSRVNNAARALCSRVKATFG